MSNIIFKEIMVGYEKDREKRGYVPELLAPAGNMEKLKVAFTYGADAVYLSGKKYGLRAQAKNFTVEEIEEACRIAHSENRRIYVTVNIFPRYDDIDRLPEYLRNLKDVGVDGLIVSDPGVIQLVREHAPGIPLHLSTQANTTNYVSAKFWESLGISRINLARELTWDEIKEIKKRVSAEIELFVHGSMCMAYSGRCILSSFLTGRSANLGDCAQPCRWRYALVEEKRPGQYFPVISDDCGSYILSSKDMCLLPHIEKLLEAKIDAFKLEGRMRGILSVATMVRIYRTAIDRYLDNPSEFSISKNWIDELKKISHREYFPGLTFSKKETSESFTEKSYIRPYTLAGIVRKIIDRDISSGSTTALIETRNPISPGTTLEFLGKNDEVYRWKVTEFVLGDGTGKKDAKPNELLRVTVPFPLFINQILRKIAD